MNIAFIKKNIPLICLMATCYIHSTYSQMDPYQNYQWGMHEIEYSLNEMNTPIPRILVVGLIDTGLDLQHPDIIHNIWRNEPECTKEGLPPTGDKIEDLDKNGFSGDCIGWNFATTSKDDLSQWVDDIDGHGTHLAGIIAAESNNGIGISSYHNQVKVLPIRVFPSSTSIPPVLTIFDSKSKIETKQTQADLISQGIDYAVLRKVDVISISLNWNISIQSDRLQKSIRNAIRAGIPIVTSAGNESTSITPFPCRDDQIICVGSLNKNGMPSTFSNFGNDVDIWAPGEDILSLFPRDIFQKNFVSIGYNILSGTSQAAPTVAVALAYWKSIQKDILKVNELKASFLNTFELSTKNNFIKKLNWNSLKTNSSSFISLATKLNNELMVDKEGKITLKSLVIKSPGISSLVKIHFQVKNQESEIYQSEQIVDFSSQQEAIWQESFVLPEHWKKSGNILDLSWTLSGEDNKKFEFQQKSKVFIKWNNISFLEKNFSLKKPKALILRNGGRNATPLREISIFQKLDKSNIWLIAETTAKEKISTTELTLLCEQELEIKQCQSWPIIGPRNLIDARILENSKNPNLNQLFIFLESVATALTLEQKIYQTNSSELPLNEIELQNTKPLITYISPFLIQDKSLVDATNKRSFPVIFTMDNMVGLNSDQTPIFAQAQAFGLIPSTQLKINDWSRSKLKFAPQLYILKKSIPTEKEPQSHQVISILSQPFEEKLKKLLKMSIFDKFLRVSTIASTSEENLTLNTFRFVLTYGTERLQKTAVLSFDLSTESFTLIKDITILGQFTPEWLDIDHMGKSLESLGPKIYSIETLSVLEGRARFRFLNLEGNQSKDSLTISKNAFYPLFYWFDPESSGQFVSIDKDSIYLYDNNQIYKSFWQRPYGLEWPRKMKSFVRPAQIKNENSNSIVSGVCWHGESSVEAGHQCLVPLENSNSLYSPIGLSIAVDPDCVPIPAIFDNVLGQSVVRFICPKRDKVKLLSIPLSY